MSKQIDLEAKANGMIPLVINPVGDTVVLNAPKPVSVNPKVEPTERNNNYKKSFEVKYGQ